MSDSNSEIRSLSVDELEHVSGGTTGDSAINSGSFSSNTGTGLNIQVDWSVVRTVAGTKDLKVSVYTWSYSLSSTSLQDGVELSVNGVSYLADSAAIHYTGAERAGNLLASFSVPGLSGTVDLVVVWHFRGSYSNVSLNDIRAEKTITV